MKWVPYAPIVEGFYWVKCRGIMSGNEYVQVAKVYASYENKPPNMLFLEGDNYQLSQSTANITHYSDRPIQPPE